MMELPINTDRLLLWLNDCQIGSGPLDNLELLKGGSQNVLLAFTRSGREYVLRCPPVKPRPTSNKVMVREARVLGALAGTGVPHPELIASCNDPGYLGFAFYLMANVPGYNPTLELPPVLGRRGNTRRNMGFSLIDGLASLAALNPADLHLENFGRPEGWIERQVERWSSELESYSQFEAWSGFVDLGSIDPIVEWLERNRPDSQWSSVTHGDYHIGNGIFDEDGTMLAIVDWEMSTLGNPMLDLCRLMLSWPESGVRHSYTMRVSSLDGFPTPREMFARFGERTGCDLGILPWFEVLASFKLGVILEGTFARAQAGKADLETGQRFHSAVCALFERARGIIANN